MTRMWRLAADLDGVLGRVTITLESNDPELVARVEQAASRAGVPLVAELEALAGAPTSGVRAAIRDAIADDVDPSRLPGLEATVDRVLDAIAAAGAFVEERAE